MICEKCEALSALIDGYRRERNEAQARVIDAALIHAELVRERDEARAEVEQMQNRCAHVHGCLDQALEERDDAQEAYREARASRWHVSKKWDEALKEIERLRTENRDMSRALTDAIEIQRNACTAAYRRGAEAMREACARWMSEREGISQWVYDDALSALPIPEEP